MSFTNFRTLVWAHYKKHGRHTLSWRKTRDPYRILVSEIMLQQTQVDRVIPLYAHFMKRFPTPKKLATAPLSKVLTLWQGLGYNRRAKMLHDAAKDIVKNGMPKTVEELEALPGVGRYTARAVTAFAYNQDVFLLETNIRTAIIHHFFANKKKVSDPEIEEILKRVLPKGNAREWYSALMDYGAHLKRSGLNLNAKSNRYVKQKQFKGSDREVRGAILRELTKEGCTEMHLIGILGHDRLSQVRTQIQKLQREGLITKRGARIVLSR